MEPKNRFRVIVAALVAVISIPMATQVLVGNGLSTYRSSVLNLQYRDTALTDHVRVRRQTREYWLAIEIFQNRRKAGETDLVAPDFNNIASIRGYIDDPMYGKEEIVTTQEEEASDTLHSAAPEESMEEVVAPVLLYEELTERDRALIRSLRRTNRRPEDCPDSLKAYLPGLFELCQSVLKNSRLTMGSVGIVNNRDWLYNVKEPKPQATMKLRMQMVEEAYNGSRRDTGVLPGRPTPYIQY